MGKKVLYAALILHSGSINTPPYKLKLPEECEGLLFVFKTKTAARKYWGRKVNLVEIKKEKCKVFVR